MVLFVPRVAFAPARCYAPAPSRQELAPIFSLFDEALKEVNKASRQHHTRSQRVIHPRFDVNETRENYEVYGELPGVNQEDIEIEFADDQTLTVKGKSERTSAVSQPAVTTPAKEQEAVAGHSSVAEESVAVASESDTASVKSHQPTVEDDFEDLADYSDAGSTARTSVGKGKQPATEGTDASEQPQPQQQEQAQEQQPNQEDNHRTWISERSFGSFSRTFRFPVRVDRDAVSASFKNGILTVVVPKAPVPELRRIQIQ